MNIPLPKLIWLMTGNACNYQCLFCNNRIQKRYPFMSFDIIKNLFEYFDKDSIFDLSGYGEFLLNPDFSRIIELAIDKGIGLQIVTNGELLTKDKQDLLRKSNLKLMNVSVNAITPDVKRYLSGNCGNIDIVLDNLKEFSKKPRNYTLTISMVLNRHNFKEMPLMAKLAVDLNIDLIKFLYLVPNIDYQKDFILLNDKEEKEYSDLAIDILQKGNIKFSGLIDNENTIIPPKLNIKSCNVPWTQIAIDQFGLVRPCCYQCDNVVGDLKKKTFIEVWNEDKMNDLRNAIREGNKEKYCNNCMDFE